MTTLSFNAFAFACDLLAMIYVAFALIVLYFMQTVTRDSGIGSWVEFLFALHRAIYIATVWVLALAAYHTYTTQALPDSYTGGVIGALFVLAIVSFLRHRMAPPLKQPGSWHRHARLSA